MIHKNWSRSYCENHHDYLLLFFFQLPQLLEQYLKLPKSYSLVRFVSLHVLFISDLLNSNCPPTTPWRLHVHFLNVLSSFRGWPISTHLNILLFLCTLSLNHNLIESLIGIYFLLKSI